MVPRVLLLVLVLLGSKSLSAQTFSKSPVTPVLSYPVAFTQTYDGRVFVTEKGGFTPPAVNARILLYTVTGNLLCVFHDFTDSVDCDFERGLLGITIDPGFSWNHFVYVFYTYDSDPVNGGDARIRIVRFTEASNTAQQPTMIFDVDVPDNMTGAHQGGSLHFRPSDTTHLYVSMGDQANGLGWASQLDNPFGKILRISKYPGDPPPTDNPFYDDGNPSTGNCDWIWAYGFRNAFDFCFSTVNDSLYATENGTSYYDEVNLVTKGGYYGWDQCEGTYDADTIALPCHAAGSIAPLAQFPFPVPALTGIIFYSDTFFGAQQNHLIVADYNHADLTDITLGNAPAYNQATQVVNWIDESQQYGITCLQQGEEGCIWVMEGGYTTNGGVYKICPDASSVAETAAQNSLAVTGPNPFAETTTITYTIQNASLVQLTLYDATGRVVAVLADDQQSSGTHSVQLDTQKYGLSAGIYSCVLQTEQFSQSAQLIVE